MQVKHEYTVTQLTDSPIERVCATPDGLGYERLVYVKWNNNTEPDIRPFWLFFESFEDAVNLKVGDTGFKYFYNIT